MYCMHNRIIVEYKKSTGLYSTFLGGSFSFQYIHLIFQIQALLISYWHHWPTALIMAFIISRQRFCNGRTNWTCCSELYFNSSKSLMLNDKADFLLHERLVWCVVGSYSDMTNTPFSSSALLVAAKLVMLTIPFPAAQQGFGMTWTFQFPDTGSIKAARQRDLIAMNQGLSMPSYREYITITFHAA